MPSSLVDAFVKQRVAVFVGAGVSRAAGLPNWKELLEPLRAEVEDCPDDATPLDIAQYYLNKEGALVLAQRLISHLEKDNVKPSEIHKALVRLPVERIYTTNFDNLLEKAYENEFNREPRKIISAASAAFLSDRLSVVKLHGDLASPETIVITAEDFEDYFESHPALAQQIIADLFQRTLLFVGYSFMDPDIRTILRQMRRHMGPFAPNHYIIQINPPDPVEKELIRRGLKVIRLDGRPNHTESVLRWLQGLQGRLRQTIPQPPPPPPGSKHNLPIAPGDLVGRSEAIASVEEAIQKHRVVLLVGEPGVGKTSVALRVAHNAVQRKAAEAFEYVVWLTAREGESVQLWFSEVLNRIALTLEFPRLAQMPSSEVDKKGMSVRMLLENRRTLIVLDNFEAMSDASLSTWVSTIPAPSQVLITSRANVAELGKKGFVIPLRGLDDQAAIALLEQYSSEAGGPGIRGGEVALRKIAEVTSGNPQAMRLAAGVLQDEKFRFEDVAGRLNELKSKVDELFNQLFGWSWSVLTFVGEQLLVVTALFPGASSMTSEAIEASAGLSHSDFLAGMAQVRRLGLLTDIGEDRFAIHPKTRQYALEKLARWEKYADEARERCARYYLKFAKDRIVRSKPPVPYWNVLVTDNMKLLDREWPLLKELMTWATRYSKDDLLAEFVMLLVHYLDSRFLNAERLEYVSGTVDALSTKTTRFQEEALLRIDALGWTYVEESRWTEAHEQIDRGLQLAGRLNDADLVALAHAWKGRALIEEGHQAEADLQINAALGDSSIRSPWIRVRIYMAAGDIALKNKYYEEALDYFQQSFSSAAEYGGEGGGYQIYPRIGMALMNLGRVPEAEEKFQAVHDLQGIPIGNLYGEYGLALVALSREQSGESERRLEHARKELEDRTTSNLLWKLLKDLQTQLQNARNVTGTS